MKIVVTGTRGIPNIMGGVETHCEELFPRIAKRGFDVTVIRRTDYVKDDLKEWKGVKLVNIDSPKKKSFEAIIHTFRAINEAKRLKADILHIHAIGPALLVPYAKMLGMKVVFTHHGPDYDRDKWGFAAKTMLKLGERMGCMFADEVIVISDVIRNLIKRKYNRTSHVHLIYNGVSQPEICDYPEYFNELGIEKGKYILGMCRFVPEKNLHHLVEAFTKVKSRNEVEDIKLVLAGDTDFEDDYSRNLKEMARKNGVALLEAMSYGVKVIVSDIPANKEVGLPESDYFPVGNVDALTEKLKTVVNQPLQHIDYDMKKYDWEKIADQVRDVYWRNRGGSRTISASLYKS